MQVIWGYLQVGEILSTPEQQKAVSWHPHSIPARTSNPTNVIFKASKQLSFAPTLPGAGILPFDKKRVLTLYGASKGTWTKNPVYDVDNILSNRKNNAKDPQSGIYYAGIWQELALKESDACIEWCRSILCKVYQTQQHSPFPVLSRHLGKRECLLSGQEYQIRQITAASVSNPYSSHRDSRGSWYATRSHRLQASSS